MVAATQAGELSTEVRPTTPATQKAVKPGFGDMESFGVLVEMATRMANTPLVPGAFRGNVGNTMIALELASRAKLNPITVMQNIHVINGKPSFSAQFQIGQWNSCGKFGPIRYIEKPGECIAVSTDLASGETLQGTTVTVEMAKAEGWFSKNGSKWQTMPEQMLRYRAATFLIRAFAPELALGFPATEEIEDVHGGTAMLSHEPEQDPKAIEAIGNTAAAEEVYDVEPEAAPAAVTPANTPVAAVAEPVAATPVNAASDVIPAAANAPEPVAAALPVADPVAAAPLPSDEPAPSTVTDDSSMQPEQTAKLQELISKLALPKPEFVTMLSGLGVSSPRDLTTSQAEQLIAVLQERANNAELDRFAEAVSSGEGGAGAAAPSA